MLGMLGTAHEPPQSVVEQYHLAKRYDHVVSSRHYQQEMRIGLYKLYTTTIDKSQYTRFAC